MDEDATKEFAEFYEAWFARVYNYARHRTGSVAAADEVVSDTFSRALRSWPAFDPGKGEPRTWLFSIAFRAVADHFRSTKREACASVEDLPELPEGGAGEGGPPREVEDALTQEQLAEVVQRLPGPQREVVSLKFYAQMTNRAIGGLLGISESNVAVTLFRAIRKMRRSFANVEA